MATDPSTTDAPPKSPYVPRISPEELARSNQELRELLDSWEEEGDEEEQRETLAILREALDMGPDPADRDVRP